MKSLLCHPLLRVSMLAAIAAAAALCADTGPLRVGAGRVEFTKLAPPPPTPPTGKYEHEKLFVRAIVMDNGATRAALISVDGAAPASGRVKAAEELKCPIENVIISSTHSHSAGLGGPAPGTPGFTQRDPNAPSPLDSVVVEAIRQAVSKLQPARMGFGTGRSYLNVNRDAINPATHLWTQDANPNAPSDKTVAVLKFETPAGDPIAFYMNYSMHPVNLYLGGILSADYPGTATRYIEQIYGDKVVAVFSQGAEGDQNPLYLRAAGAAQLQRGGQQYTGQPLVKEAVEAEIREGRRPMVPLDAKAADAIERFIDAEGIIFAEEVLRVVNSTGAKAGNVRIAGMQKTLTCPGRTRLDQGREGHPGTYKDGPDVNFLIGMVGIGDVGFVSINAEVYNQIGQNVKEKSPMANTVFVGLANGSANSGYVPTDDAYGHNTFQVLGARTKEGCAETGIQNTMVDLLVQYSAPMAGTK
jgi:hypothetical protein